MKIELISTMTALRLPVCGDFNHAPSRAVNLLEYRRCSIGSMAEAGPVDVSSGGGTLPVARTLRNMMHQNHMSEP